MTVENIVIAGSGPAGLSAAIYAARAGVNPLVIEGGIPGGQLTVSYDVENYPGVPGAVPGTELVERMRTQATGFGVRFLRETVVSVRQLGRGFEIMTDDMSVKAVALIIATGAESGEAQNLACDGVFVAIGHSPGSAAFRGIVDIDSEGYIRVEPYSAQTSTPGIFACGDVCDAIYKQAVVAAGHGCMAAPDAIRYLETEERYAADGTESY